MINFDFLSCYKIDYNFYIILLYNIIILSWIFRLKILNVIDFYSINIININIILIMVCSGVKFNEYKFILYTYIYIFSDNILKKY